MNKPFASTTPAEGAKARFSKAEFLAMAATGAFDDMKIELVNGELERMNPPMSEHGRKQMSIGFALRDAVAGTELIVLGETGIDIDDSSIVGCDLAVVRSMPAENRLLRPEELLLVVEIAETTLDRDMGLKRIAYARAGIAHYWVIDGKRRVAHVFGEPASGDYSDVRSVKFGEPLAVPETGRTIILD